MIARLKTEAEKGLEALKPHNEAAFTRFMAQGLPHRRVEDYKYTDLRALINEALPLATAHDKQAKALIKGVAPRKTKLVFVGGVFDTALSDELPKGVTLTETTPQTINPLWENDAIVLLNQSFAGKAYEFSVSAQIEKPIALLHVNTENYASYSHIRVNLAENTAITLVEYELGEGANHHNGFMKIEAAAGSKFEHLRILSSDKASQNLSTINAIAQSNAEIRSFTLNEGGGLSRNQFFVELKGDDCKLDLSGISLLSGKLHGDVTLQVKHSGLRGISREKFKYVLSNGAKAVFQGKIIVDKDAQKTDGKMASNAVMLDDLCEMMNKPELEIYADDVLCGHGATCGELDDDLLFYMQARGLDDETAKALLLQAFVGDAIEQIENESLKQLVQDRVELKLRG